VINRYEARTAAADDVIESDIENEGEIEELASLAERALRMPNEQDPGIWRVRVRVSLCSNIPKTATEPASLSQDGAEEESTSLLQNRLKARPRWAFSIFLPPGSRQWIYVESASRDYVHKLCENLSTFPHPLQIVFVPIEERLERLNGSRTTPSIMPGSWVRLKRKSELEELLQNFDQDERLIKYANDLGYVTRQLDDCHVAVCLVPRLLTLIESNGAGAKKRKRCPRLIHPNALGDPKYATEVAHRLDPNVWWDPKSRYELVQIPSGVYRLAKPNSTTTMEGSDDFLLPFAYFAVPTRTLYSTGVVPKLSELRLFGEGFAIGAKELQFPNVDPELMSWSFENHVAAPLEIGHKVEIKLDAGTMRGVIVDVRFDDVVVQVDDSVDGIEVDARHVRRIYEVGDTVKVVVPTNFDCEGWVVDVGDEKIVAFNRNKKEHVRGCSFFL
jgi:hypothetical protein